MPELHTSPDDIYLCPQRDLVISSGGIERGRITQSGTSSGALIPSETNTLNAGYGILGATFDRRLASGTVQPASGTLRAGAVVMRSGRTIGHVATCVTTGGSGLTHGWILLFDGNYNLIAQTADQTTGTFASTGWTSPIALTTPYTPTSDQVGYLGYLGTQSAGAMPILAANNGTGISFTLDAINGGPRAGWQQAGLSSPPNPAVPATAGILPLIVTLT